MADLPTPSFNYFRAQPQSVDYGALVSAKLQKNRGLAAGIDSGLGHMQVSRELDMQEKRFAEEDMRRAASLQFAGEMAVASGVPAPIVERAVQSGADPSLIDSLTSDYLRSQGMEQRQRQAAAGIVAEQMARKDNLAMLEEAAAEKLLDQETVDTLRTQIGTSSVPKWNDAYNRALEKATERRAATTARNNSLSHLEAQLKAAKKEGADGAPARITPGSKLDQDVQAAIEGLRSSLASGSALAEGTQRILSMISGSKKAAGTPRVSLPGIGTFDDVHGLMQGGVIGEETSAQAAFVDQLSAEHLASTSKIFGMAGDAQRAEAIRAYRPRMLATLGWREPGQVRRGPAPQPLYPELKLEGWQKQLEARTARGKPTNAPSPSEIEAITGAMARGRSLVEAVKGLGIDLDALTDEEFAGMEADIEAALARGGR